MKKYSAIIFLIVILVACSKKDDGNIADYEMQNQSFTISSDSCTLTIDKGSIPNGAIVTYQNYSINYYTYIFDSLNHYYTTHCKSFFTINGNIQQLLKPVHYNFNYIKDNALTFHNEIKPYKVIFNSSNKDILNSHGPCTIIPILNYTIDSLNHTISFDDKEINFLYIICRKS